MSQPGTAEKKPFHLKGNFAPIFEEFTDTSLEVTGSIPPELCGRFFRNGPNPQTGWSPHWFLGNGMIHGVELQGGRATWYRNRYVRTPYFANPEANAMEALTDPTMSAANTHVLRHAGRILALEEAHFPFELTPELETVGPHDFGGRLKTPVTAHPKICPVTGEMFAFGYQLTPPFLTYHRVSAEGELVQTEEITVPAATMIHDFNLTRNFVVFMDLPVVWDAAGLEAGGLPIRWSDEYGARLGVMPREGRDADVVWYEIDPCYVFHPMNAYEDGDRIVIDVCRLDHLAKLDGSTSLPRLTRWGIDRATGKVTEDRLDERAAEFPRIHDDRVGKPYRFGYAAGVSEKDGATTERYLKYDLETGACVDHELPDGREGSEPVFVPAAGASAEDEGWVLSFVYDPAVDRSELVVLDATHFDRPPVARIHLPTRVPAGFHGSWLPDAGA